MFVRRLTIFSLVVTVVGVLLTLLRPTDVPTRTIRTPESMLTGVVPAPGSAEVSQPSASLPGYHEPLRTIDVACTVLSPRELDELFNTPFEPLEPTAGECRWSSEDGLMLVVAGMADRARTLYEYQSAHRVVDVVNDLGEAALLSQVPDGWVVAFAWRDLFVSVGPGERAHVIEFARRASTTLANERSETR